MSHLLEKFRFCPECGSPEFEVNDFKSRRCHACGFTYYMNAATAVAVVLEGPSGVLVCRRAFEPAAGTLDLVGGFVDPGESMEEAAVRETREECGVEIDASSLRFIGSFHNEYIYSGLTVHTCDAIFVATLPEGSSVVAADDASECLWIPYGELASRIPDFGFASIRAALKSYVNR